MSPVSSLLAKLPMHLDYTEEVESLAVRANVHKRLEFVRLGAVALEAKHVKDKMTAVFCAMLSDALFDVLALTDVDRGARGVVPNVERMVTHEFRGRILALR